MLGWILGSLGVIALFSALRRHRYHRRYPHFVGFYGRRGLRGRGLLRGMFMQLETTPGQENAIVDALDDALERMRGMKGELRGARRELAALIASDTLDEAALDDLLSRQRGQLQHASDALLGVVLRVHEVLDDAQRRELGALIAEGSLGPTMVRGYTSRHCGPVYDY